MLHKHSYLFHTNTGHSFKYSDIHLTLYLLLSILLFDNNVSANLHAPQLIHYYQLSAPTHITTQQVKKKNASFSH